MLPDPLPLDVVDKADPPADEATAPIQPTVAQLLATSRSAHLQYHQFLPRMAAVAGASPQAQAGDAAAALAALKSAAASRAQAELVDPQHRDPAWADDSQTSPHQELLVFYLQQLSR